MSQGPERTYEAFRADVALVLARIARAKGIEGLRQNNTLKSLMAAIGGTHAVEEALAGPIAMPNEAELEALGKQAVALLREYPLLKAKANAGKAQMTLPLAPPPPPPLPPSPPPVPQPQPIAPPRPYELQLFPDPLFVRDIGKRQGPKPRDLASSDAMGKILERQTSAIATFFGEPREGGGTAPDVTAWSAHFELGEELCIVVGPLSGLPGFVKTLDIVAGNFRTTVLASNLRSGTTRIPVEPSVLAYTFSAGDFDDELSEELRALTLSGFAPMRATAFRVDVAEEGQMLSGATVSPGRCYRLLVPPSFADVWVGQPSRELADGWRVMGLELPPVVPDELRETVRRLGLAIAQSTLDVDFVGVAPREWRIGRNRTRYARFRPDDAPVVLMSGVETKERGELVVFLAGPSGQTSHSLPAGRDFLVKLGPLPEGRYALDVLSVDMTREPERLLFEVDARAGEVIGMESAGAVLSLGEERISIEEDVVREVDASKLDEATLGATAPPLWRVTARWEGERSRPLPAFFADRGGLVPTGELLALTRMERETERVADLWIDFGEMGRVLLRHERRPSAREVTRELRRLHTERGSILDEVADLALLGTIWIEPVCSALGYRATKAEPAPGDPLGFVAWDLRTIVRDEGRIALERPCILLAFTKGTDFATTASGGARDTAARRARHEGLSRAILTDGSSWALWEKGRVIVKPPVDLIAALEDEDDGRLETFLYAFHA